MSCQNDVIGVPPQAVSMVYSMCSPIADYMQATAGAQVSTKEIRRFKANCPIMGCVFDEIAQQVGFAEARLRGSMPAILDRNACRD
jgi:hypothetical protein